MEYFDTTEPSVTVTGPTLEVPHSNTSSQANGTAEDTSKTILQLFDPNSTGVIYPLDSFRGLHKLGLGMILSILCMALIHPPLSYLTQASWIPDMRCRVHVDGLRRGVRFFRCMGFQRWAGLVVYLVAYLLVWPEDGVLQEDDVKRLYGGEFFWRKDGKANEE